VTGIAWLIVPWLVLRLNETSPRAVRRAGGRPRADRARRVAADPSLIAEIAAVPDGVAFDAEARCTSRATARDRICRIPHGGESGILVDDPEGTLIASPTNVAYGGDDLERLFVASLGR
jgi:sugar lactone lactonase YvrE